ncbi:MAG: elongation factor P, partial [Myxococcota bacterium]|nr:elongation factor P [Myxococcota bacterium]
GATKNAKLETGIEVQVPLFIEVGEKLMIDTRECRYLRRSN